MGIAERQNEILRILCRRRHETIPNLAAELGVSERTIRRDIESLSLTAPIYTQPGRYDGGVYVMDGYSMDRVYFKEREADVLRSLVISAEQNGVCTVGRAELLILKEILASYSKPKVQENKRKGVTNESIGKRIIACTLPCPESESGASGAAFAQGRNERRRSR